MGVAASPCRLFVYLAREAPIAVVLRRGPSAWAQLSVWHTDNDTFEHGQWFKGRVYERRGDVSADGGLFVYFTRKSAARAPADSWVAISRPPWFTALALWFVGGTYYTGGLFPDGCSLWLGFDGSRPDEGRLPRWLATTTAAPPYIDRTTNWTQRTVYINRLLRDGWERVEDAPLETWQRRHPANNLTLVMTQRSDIDYEAYGGPYVVEYGVRSEPAGPITPLGRATWADWDQGGRLVIARGGRLFHWQRGGLLREIADFNPHVPVPTPAPAWARMWTGRPSRAP